MRLKEIEINYLDPSLEDIKKICEVIAYCSDDYSYILGEDDHDKFKELAFKYIMNLKQYKKDFINDVSEAISKL